MAIELWGIPCDRLSYRLAGRDAHRLRLRQCRIKHIRTDRIQTERIAKIVLVAGFQGINKYGDVPDRLLAAALHADLCQIYTDVDGVYTADPRR